MTTSKKKAASKPSTAKRSPTGRGPGRPRKHNKDIADAAEAVHIRPTTANHMTVDRVCFALGKAIGNMTAAARLLGVTRGALYLFIKKNPDLETVVKDCREEMIDAAESALYSAITKEQPWAVCFSLKCLGKDRGYIERQEVKHSGHIDLTNMTDEELDRLEQSVITSKD